MTSEPLERAPNTCIPATFMGAVSRKHARTSHSSLNTGKHATSCLLWVGPLIIMSRSFKEKVSAAGSDPVQAAIIKATDSGLCEPKAKHVDGKRLSGHQVSPPTQPFLRPDRGYLLVLLMAGSG